MDTMSVIIAENVRESDLAARVGSDLLVDLIHQADVSPRQAKHDGKGCLR